MENQASYMAGYLLFGVLAVHWFLPPFPTTGRPESPPRHSSVLLSSISAAYMHSFSPHSQIPCDPSWYSGFRERNVDLQYNISIHITCLSFNLIYLYLFYKFFFISCIFLNSTILLSDLIILYVIRP